MKNAIISISPFFEKRGLKTAFLIICAVFFTITGEVNGAWWWPPSNTEILPENPTSADVVVITLSGSWPDSGVPDGSAISVSGNNIYFDVIDQSSFGLTVITPWERKRSVGPLAAGTYTVFTRLLGDRFVPEIYTQAAQFTVSSGSHVDTVYYVDAIDGNDSNNGLSPETSFATIRKAVDTAKSGDSIIVAEGVYTEDGNHDIDFHAKAINVRGTDPNDPEVVAATVIDCQQNSSGFRFRSNEPPSARVSGLTIINASYSAIYCDDYSCPTIDRCVMKFNHGFSGGGIRCRSFSSPTIRNCTISGNTAVYDGGGIYCSDNSDAIITNCVINDNSAGGFGGGGYGGGIDIVYSNSTISNCTITGNSAAQRGGGVNVGYIANVDITNCILWDNIASNGSQIAILDASSSVSYSNIQNGQSDVYFLIRPDRGCDECTLDWGPGNIDIDPCFVDADGNDFHLKSQAGRWDLNSESWVLDAVTSPCIDGGNLSSPIGLEPFPNGGRVNMGAYGGTDQASKSYFGTTPCQTIMAGDINGDCEIDLVDFAIMANNWLWKE